MIATQTMTGSAPRLAGRRTPRPTPQLRVGAALVAVALSGPACASLVSPPALAAQQARSSQGKVLGLDDYPRWNRVTEVRLSPDGRWVSFAYSPNEGDAVFRIRSLDGSAGGDVPLVEAVNGGSVEFSDDSRWAAFLTSPSEEEARRLRRERKPIPRALELVRLGSSGAAERIRIEDVQGFRFAPDARHLAVEKSRADREADHEGRDLLVRELASGSTRNIGNVASYAFNEDGALLAFVLDAAGKTGNGLYVLELLTGVTHVLDGDTLRYAAPVWDESGSRLAVLRGERSDTLEQRENVLLAFTGLGVRPPSTAAGSSPGSSPGRGAGSTMSGYGSRLVYDPAMDAMFPGEMVLSELSDPSWSTDGTFVRIGIKEQRRTAPAAASDGEERANVDVWHWADERVQSVQMVQADADRRFTYEALVHLPDAAAPAPALAADAGGGARYVRLADEDMPRVSLTRDGAWVIGQRDGPYRGVMDMPGGRRDLVRIEPRSGTATILAEGVRYVLGTSPDGRWLLYSRDGSPRLVELASGVERELTAPGTSFENTEADRPGERPTYGLAGWSRDGDAVLLNDRFDVWSVPLRGGDPVNVTAGVGAREEVRFRVLSLDPESDEDGLDTSRPLLLSAFGERDKRSGWWTVSAGGGEPRPLLWEDRMLGGLVKADSADRVVFTRQTFVEFPDYWASTTDFGDPVRLTDANPHQAEYRWGSRVLVEYTDERGNELQATLTLPAGYEPGRRYPMIVYFYERMSQRHHQYSMPVYDDRPHMSAYASDGYLVLMPDVVYDEGLPGSSALDDVTSAVRRVIELGYADPDRIGLQGHSWGGYQSSFIVTQTDLFAAVVTGAPLTNLVSMHNLLYKRTGNPNAPLIQFGQGRMGVSPWDSLHAYVDQSPVHHAHRITTPFLILHGTEDGAVDWTQGLEFYMAAKRLGKEVILLSYPGEPHHLQKRANQKDFQRRMKEYFDHHLKAAPAPEWMTGGVRHLDKGREQ